MAAKKPAGAAPDAGNKEALLALKAELLEQGKKAGKIEAKDISAKIPDAPENVEILDALRLEQAVGALPLRRSPRDRLQQHRRSLPEAGFELLRRRLEPVPRGPLHAQHVVHRAFDVVRDP